MRPLSRIQIHLDELGIVLPPVFPPAGNYVPCVQVGSTLTTLTTDGWGPSVHAGAHERGA
jgi:hypothetical protein